MFIKSSRLNVRKFVFSNRIFDYKWNSLSAKHFMVFAGVCYDSKGRLRFIPDKAKVNAKLYD